MNPDIIRRLVLEYNQNPNKYSDEQAEVVATLSRQMGMDFKRGSKPNVAASPNPYKAVRKIGRAHV